MTRISFVRSDLDFRFESKAQARHCPFTVFSPPLTAVHRPFHFPFTGRHCLSLPVYCLFTALPLPVHRLSLSFTAFHRGSAALQVGSVEVFLKRFDSYSPFTIELHASAPETDGSEKKKVGGGEMPKTAGRSGGGEWVAVPLAEARFSALDLRMYIKSTGALPPGPQINLSAPPWGANQRY